MKNLFVYYLLITVPLAGIIIFSSLDLINSAQFVGLLFFYLLVYRTYVDGKRLADKNIIPKKDIWKLIIPGKRMAHVRELYFK